MNRLSVLALFLVATTGSVASDDSLVIESAITDSTIQGPFEVGILRISVVNASYQAVRNVDLRLDVEGPISLPTQVAQVGAIPAGEAGSVAIPYVRTGTDDVLHWRVDYDDAAGRHQRHTATIRATRK